MQARRGGGCHPFREPRPGGCVGVPTPVRGIAFFWWRREKFFRGITARVSAPIKHEKRRVAREAILLALSVEAALKVGPDGPDPVEAVLPIARALARRALEGDVAAIKEALDRVDGKVAQELKVEQERDVTPDAGLIGSIGELIKIVQDGSKRREKLVKEEAAVLEHQK